MNRTVEFDHIAPVYDETRRPPSEKEVQALVQLLGAGHTVLDAGVGTGRFAVPLQANHFSVVGVDLSLQMMRRARGKGITSLIRADVRHLPFRDKSLDSAFTAHVLQLLPEPRPILLELARIARRVVVVLLPQWAERDSPGQWHRLRERYRELAAELGFPLPARGQRYRHTIEELSAIAPPKLIVPVEGAPPPNSDFSDWLARWEARATCGSPVPPEIHAEIVRRLEAEQPVTTAQWNRPRVERFVAWDPSDFPTSA
jgi:ubiquinone/menaquinone biosynthesis C-methylase UbiE